MTFQETKIDNFKDLAMTIKDRIRNFPGCEHLDLLQDNSESNIFFSYSYWQSEDALNEYRKSDFFRQTWSKTRQWFSAKPEAWTLDHL